MNYVKKYPWEEEKEEEKNNKVVSSFPWDNYESPTFKAINSGGAATGSVLGTIARAGVSAGEGFLRAAEGVGDLANLGIGGIQDLLGYEEAAKASRKAAQRDTTEWLTQPAKDTYDPYAYNGFKSGQLGDQIGQGIGQVGFMVGSAGVTGVAPTATGLKATATRLAPIFTSSTGSGTVESLNKGNSMGKSLLYGAGRGAIEAGSEALFGGLGKVIGKGALDDIVVNSITKSIKKPLLKNLTALGIKAIGEGFEENVSGLLTPVLDKMLLDPNTKMYWQDENGKFTLTKVGTDFLVGTLTSLIAQSPSSIQNTFNEKKNIDTLNKIEIELAKKDLTIEQRQTLETTKAKITEAMQERNYTNEQLPQPIQTPQQTEVNGVTEQDIIGGKATVYHGSPITNIESFDISKSGTNNSKGSEKGIMWFTNNKDIADEYSYEKIPTKSNFIETKGKQGKVYEAKINILKPLDLRNMTIEEAKIISENGMFKYSPEKVLELSQMPNRQLLKTELTENVINKLKENGYDGIVADYDENGNREYGVFDNKQITQNTIADSINDTKVVDNTGKLIPKEIATKLQDSKVRDEQGNPIKVYHATNAEFDTFDMSKAGSANDPGIWGHGIYFANRDTTGIYGKNLKEAYLDFKNPLVISDFKSIQEIADYLDIVESNFRIDEHGIPRISGTQARQLSSQAKEKGHDGIIVNFPPTETNGKKNKPWSEYVVFDPKQIIQPNTIAEEIQKDDDVLTIKDTKPQPKQVVDQRVAQIQETLTPKTTEERSMLKQAVIKLVDKGYYIDKLARATKNNELSAKYDTMLMASGTANNIIGGNGFLNANGEKIGKSLYETFDPVTQAKKTKDFNDYMYHRLNIDRMTLQDRGYGDNKPVFGETITAEMSKEIVAKYEKANPEFKTWAEDVYKYNDNLLKRAIDNGILNEESYKYYKEKYPNYVPIRRVDTGTQTGQIEGLNRASVGKPIKVAKGGSQDLIPLKEAMAMNTISMERAGKRNTFANELSKTLGTTLEQQKADIENVIENVDTDSDLLTKGENGNSPTLTYYENGQRNTIAITNEIYDALETTYLRSFKIANKISNIRRGLITEYNLAFMFTNPIKDIQDGYINTKHPKTFAKNLVEATKQIAKKGKYYQMYVANGGNSNSYFNYKDGFVQEQTPKGIKGAITYPLRKISQINQSIEMTPRLAEFISSIEAGDSIDTAMYNAAEITTNFKRGGDWSKFANKNGATFFNASIQGTYKQVKNVQQAISNGPRGIAMLAVRFVLAGIPFTILNDLLWGDDDEYEELSDYVKDNYYIIGKYADGKFIRIPKGRVVGVIQKAIDNTRKTPTEGLEVWNTFLSQVENSILPNDPTSNNIASPIIDALTDKAWHGGDLTPMRLKDKNPEDQWDESTDELSKFIGKNLGISPYKINYVLDQYSGVIGDIGLPAITKEAEQGNGVIGKALAPLVDKFTTDSVLKNQKVSDFYDLTEKFRLAAQKEKATSSTIYSSKALNKNKAAISKLYKQKREIQLSDLPDKEKYNDAREIQKRINSIANDAIIQYKGKIGE